MKTGGIILAGGKSRRLGQNKCLLNFKNKTLVEIVADNLSVVCEDVFVVTKEKETIAFTGLKIVEENDERQLPLIGLLAGLSYSRYEGNILTACDMPFLNQKSLKILIDNSKGYEAVVPVIGGRAEPLHAYYSRNLKPLIEIAIKQDSKLTDFLNDAKVNYLNEEIFKEHDPQLLSFYNINTEDDYRKALKIE